MLNWPCLGKKHFQSRGFVEEWIDRILSKHIVTNVLWTPSGLCAFGQFPPLQLSFVHNCVLFLLRRFEIGCTCLLWHWQPSFRQYLWHFFHFLHTHCCSGCSFCFVDLAFRSWILASVSRICTSKAFLTTGRPVFNPEQLQECLKETRDLEEKLAL